jgi:hypothetical protein
LSFESRPATAGVSRPRLKTNADEGTETSENTPRQLKYYLRVALMVLGQLFLYASLLAQENVTSPNAVELAHIKYGYKKNAAYTKDVDNVSLFVPFLSKLFPNVHLEIHPKSNNHKKSWRTLSPQSHKTPASIGIDKGTPSSSDWLSCMSTSDWPLFMDPKETMIQWTKAKQVVPARASKAKVSSLADWWKIPRMFPGNKSKDDDCKACGNRKVMWRLDPDKIFLYCIY